MGKMSRREKVLTGIAAGAIAAGVLAAAAASLGGLSVSDVGGTSSIVAACQTTGLSLTNWGAAAYSGVTNSNSYFYNNSVLLTGILAGPTGCGVTSRQWALAIADASGTVLVSTSGNMVAASGMTISWTGSATSTTTEAQAILTIYN